MGLSWLWVALSAGIIFLWQQKNKTYTAAYIIFILILNTLGWARLSSYEDMETNSEKWRVALIQGSAPMKWDEPVNVAHELAKVVDEITSLSLESVSKSNSEKPIQLIVWPESAVPYLSYESSDYLRIRIQQVLGTSQIPLLFNDNRSRGFNWITCGGCT